MVQIIGVPEDYHVYMYAALGMMFGGVILFIVGLIDTNEFLVGASLIAVATGFFLAAGMAFGLIRKRKKNKTAELTISIFIRIILITAFAFSTYFTVFGGFFAIGEEWSGTFWVVELIAIPSVVVALITADMLLIRKRKKKEQIEKEAKELED